MTVREQCCCDYCSWLLQQIERLEREIGRAALARPAATRHKTPGQCRLEGEYWAYTECLADHVARAAGLSTVELEYREGLRDVKGG